MKKAPLLWILRKIHRCLPGLLLLTAARVGSGVFGVFFALGSRAVIDSAASKDYQVFWKACMVQALIVVGILLCLTMTRHLKDRLSADLERDWKRHLHHGILHSEYTAISGYHSGELMNRLNNDVQKVDEGILSVLPGTAGMITRLMAAVAVLGMLDSTFLMIMLSLGFVVIVVTAMMRRKLKELNKQVSEQDGKVSAYLQETIEKILVIQAMDLSAEVERRADRLLDHRYNVQRTRKNASLFANTCISLMAYGSGFAALVWCAFQLLQGQMSFGSLTAVIQLVNQLRSPFVNLSGIMPQYTSMIASAERLMELEAIWEIPQEETWESEELYDSMCSLRADDVSFSYGRDTILDSVTYEIPKGSFCAVTGQSGAGKSTLLKLMLGIFPLDGGKLYLQKTEECISLSRKTRKLFAYVPQGSYLFSGTLRDNLLLAKANATDAEISEAVYAAGMDAFLLDLPEGLDTRIGENNAGISEGQAQRLAIARAVLGGAPILLLDECTSALDMETERMVLKRLRLLPNRTCIAVTHRPAAIAVCDCQLEFRDGKIITYTTK